MVHIWVYITICSHIYKYLDAYTTLKHIYTSYLIFMHVNLYLNAFIYTDICVYRRIFTCIWSHPTSVLIWSRLLTGITLDLHCAGARDMIVYVQGIWFCGSTSYYTA